jgi:hypothetical protein
MLHEAVWAKELAERRLRATAPITPGLRSKSTAEHLLAAKGPVVKYVDAAEERIAIAAVLSAAADAGGRGGNAAGAGD